MKVPGHRRESRVNFFAPVCVSVCVCLPGRSGVQAVAAWCENYGSDLGLDPVSPTSLLVVETGSSVLRG